MATDVKTDNPQRIMKRPDVDVVYDHENRCVWADNRQYVLKRTWVRRELYDMTFEWEDKKLILEIGKGIASEVLDRKHPDYRNSLKFDDGHFENSSHKFKSWDELEQIFAILFLCLEKFIVRPGRNYTGLGIESYWNKSGFAMYRFEELVIKRIASEYPRFVWTDPK